MSVERLTDKNYIVYCANRYVNPTHYTTEDFVEDLKRVRYVKKLLSRYRDCGELRERLILNHIIVLSNCFGAETACRMLWHKLPDHLHLLKPFLLYLGLLPDELTGIGDEGVVRTREVLADALIMKRLREL